MKTTTKPDARQAVNDPQVQPLPGEVALEDARHKALHFAVVEKLRLDAARRGSDAKDAISIGSKGAKGK